MNPPSLLPIPAALLMVALLPPVPVRAGEAAPQLPSSFDPAAIDRFLQAEVQRKGRVGLSVAIVKDGRCVLARGYGQRSLTPPLPVETNTLFAIGSVTKQFTAACVLLLAADGKLSVYDQVAKYFPELTRAADITLLDLMNHVSGYPDNYPLDFVDRAMAQPAAPDDVIRQYGTRPLDFEPGTRYSYSNTGYLILGRVVEKVSEEPFGAFLSRRILGPLGMDHTAYEPDKSDGRLARGYSVFALSPPEPVVPEGKGWIGGAGAIYSTPSDLALWDLALMAGRLLKPDSFKLMATPRQLPDGATTEYGCGLRVTTQEKRLVLVHAGMVAGFNAWNAMVPSTKSAVIMAANTGAGLGDLPDRVLALLLKEEHYVPKVNGPIAAEAARQLFLDLQRGKVDRSQLAAEFNWFLSPEKMSAAAKRLKRFGSPTKVELLNVNERGGLEVSAARLTFRAGALRTLMYRRPDGIVEQFFVNED